MTPPAPKKRSTGRTTRPSATVREADPPVPKHPPITLIVGTDTGVGKTWVTCAVARALAELGQKVIAAKPIETGLGEAKVQGAGAENIAGREEKLRAMRQMLQQTLQRNPGV